MYRSFVIHFYRQSVLPKAHQQAMAEMADKWSIVAWIPYKISVQTSYSLRSGRNSNKLASETFLHLLRQMNPNWSASTNDRSFRFHRCGITKKIYISAFDDYENLPFFWWQRSYRNTLFFSIEINCSHSSASLPLQRIPKLKICPAWKMDRTALLSYHFVYQRSFATITINF